MDTKNVIAAISLSAAVIILYSLWFIIATTSIWFVQTQSATEVLRSLLTAGRFPVSSYPNLVRIIFTLIIPVAFLTSVPAEAFLGKISILTIFVSFIVSIMFFYISRKFWTYALKFYTSASSWIIGISRSTFPTLIYSITLSCGHTY